MRREQAVHESNLERNERTKSNADYSGKDREPTIERCELFPGVRKGRTNRHGDHDHSGNRSHAKHQQIDHCPSRIANSGQHQQSDGRRACQSMHDSDRQRPKHLVETDFLQRLRQAALRRFLKVQVNFRRMRMHVLVTLRSMLMRVGMHNLSVGVSRRESVGDPLRNPGKIQYAQQNEHETDRQFHCQANLDWNGQVENDDARSHNQDRQRMTKSPESADQARMTDTLLTAYDRSDRYHVVGVSRVPHPEKESETDNGEQVGQAGH